MRSGTATNMEGQRKHSLRRSRTVRGDATHCPRCTEPSAVVFPPATRPAWHRQSWAHCKHTLQNLLSCTAKSMRLRRQAMCRFAGHLRRLGLADRAGKRQLLRCSANVDKKPAPFQRRSAVWQLVSDN